jgi:pyridoxamine 5'-phosphate oxidase
LASNQSEEVESREKLEKRLEELKEQYSDDPIPMPESWGGYRLKPSSIEFWQGRRGRLHDRLLYEFVSGKWTIKRLSP